MSPILIPLKAKYLLPGKLLHRQGIDPPEGTWCYSAGRFAAKPRTNTGKKQGGISLRPRMRAYFGSVGR